MLIQNQESKYQSRYSKDQATNQTHTSFSISAQRNSCISLSSQLSSETAKDKNSSKMFKKHNSIRSYYLVALSCIALFLVSCQKEKLSDTVVNSASAANNSASAGWLSRTRSSFNASTRYGALINPPDPQQNWLGFQLDVADQLGVSCLRASTYVPATWSVNSLLNSSYKIVLNFNSARSYGSDPIPYVKDLTQYKKDLNSVLNSYSTMPVVAVIENEESNKIFYTGTPQEYINQLNAAISVMHARGIKVANGGFTGPSLALLVYQDFLDQGKKDSAQMFMDLTNLTPGALTIQERADFNDVLLQAYTKMDLDYVNFHWKGEEPNDAEAVREIINYLRKRTGKSVISNELGQFDTDPNTVTAFLQAVSDKNIPYALWYSPDENAGKKDTPLQHSNASLTKSGVAYQSFLAN